MELSAVEWRGWRVRGGEGGKVKSGQEERGGVRRNEERRGEEKRGEEVYGLSPGILLH